MKKKVSVGVNYYKIAKSKQTKSIKQLLRLQQCMYAHTYVHKYALHMYICVYKRKSK